jgi:hypothetical protein
MHADLVHGWIEQARLQDEAASVLRSASADVDEVDWFFAKFFARRGVKGDSNCFGYAPLAFLGLLEHNTGNPSCAIPTLRDLCNMEQVRERQVIFLLSSDVRAVKMREYYGLNKVDGTPNEKKIVKMRCGPRYDESGNYSIGDWDRQCYMPSLACVLDVDLVSYQPSAPRGANRLTGCFRDARQLWGRGRLTIQDVRTRLEVPSQVSLVPVEWNGSDHFTALVPHMLTSVPHISWLEYPPVAPALPPTPGPSYPAQLIPPPHPQPSQHPPPPPAVPNVNRLAPGPMVPFPDELRHQRAVQQRFAMANPDAVTDEALASAMGSLSSSDAAGTSSSGSHDPEAAPRGFVNARTGLLAAPSLSGTRQQEALSFLELAAAPRPSGSHRQETTDALPPPPKPPTPIEHGDPRTRTEYTTLDDLGPSQLDDDNPFESKPSQSSNPGPSLGCDACSLLITISS